LIGKTNKDYNFIHIEDIFIVFRKERDVKSQGSDDGTSMSPRTPEG